jgi:hypothetical protein
VTVFETPLVAHRSIDHMVRIPIKFAHCIGSRTIFEQVPALRQSHYWPLTFPSFWRNQIHQPLPWSPRKHAVLVAANKYWRERSWARIHDTKSALRVLKRRLRKRFSPTYQSCRKLQLHDARLDLLHVLGLRDQVDVFGHGWDDIRNLPIRQAKRLLPIRSMFKGPCDDKQEVLRHYKFTIAYENTAYPEWVTEKVIDAMVAGSVPVYMGAPDVVERLPAEAFVDARAFSGPEAIAAYMEQMTEAEATAIIHAGQAFLRSSPGQRYSYEGFGEWIVSLLNGKPLGE